jgi:hypothetical protein
MSLNPDRYDDVAAQEMRIRQVISRAELALSFIKARRPVKIERAN